MSRIGKKIIVIPKATEVTYSDSVITVKGPLGTLTKKFKMIQTLIYQMKRLTYICDHLKMS